MSLDRRTVARIATLARIKVPESDLDRMAGELRGILAWIEQLDEVDTADVAPMTAVVDAVLPWRDDKVADGAQAEKVLANAPDAAQGFFTVPKVVE